MPNNDLLDRVTVRPDVFGGKPIIRDMRVSVEHILSLLVQGVTEEAILEDYPDLELDDIRASTAYWHAVRGKGEGVRGNLAPRAPRTARD